MKHRDPLTATLFALFVPFYVVYWLYSTSKGLQSQGIKTPPIALLLAPVFATLGLIVIIILSTAANQSEEQAGAIMGIFLLLFVVANALSLVYYYKFGQAIQQATQENLSKGLVFILLWFVSPAAVYIIQEKINHQAGVVPAGPYPSQSASPATYQQPVSPAPEQAQPVAEQPMPTPPVVDQPTAPAPESTPSNPENQQQPPA